MGEVVNNSIPRKFIGIDGKEGGLYYNEKDEQGNRVKRYMKSGAFTARVKSIDLITVAANAANNIQAHKEVILLLEDDEPNMAYQMNLYLDSMITGNILNTLLMLDVGQEFTMWCPATSDKYPRASVRFFRDATSFKQENALPQMYKWDADKAQFISDSGEAIPKPIETEIMKPDRSGYVLDTSAITDFWFDKVANHLYPKFNAEEWNPKPNREMYNMVTTDIMKGTSKAVTAANIEKLWPRIAIYIKSNLLNKDDQYNAMKVFEREYKQAGGTKYCCIDGTMTAAPVAPPPPPPQAVAPVNTPPAVDNDMDDLPF